MNSRARHRRNARPGLYGIARIATSCAGGVRRLARLLTCLLVPSVAGAGEWAGTVTLASEYVYRGQSLSGGNPALQAGIDYEHASGWFGGAWASTVDLENFGGRRDIEFDYYVGWHYASEGSVDLTATLLRYTYPGQSTYFDYDYTELLLHATWLERYSLEYGYSNDIYGWGEAGQHWEARGDWPLRNAWILGAGLGYNVLDEQGTSNHWYWDIGASARFGWLMVDLRWYDNETPAGSLAYLSAGSQWVLSLSAGF